MIKTYRVFLLIPIVVNACNWAVPILSTSQSDSAATATLAPNPSPSVSPIPSPIGGGKGQISYWAQDNTSAVNIYLVDLDHLADEAKIIGLGESPSWSPDGAQIAYVQYTNSGSDIYIIDADGKNQKQITSADGGEWEPVWSPDGEQIAYSYEHGEIHVINTDGTNNQVIVSSGLFDYYSPAWSPDGKKLAFLEASGGLSAELYIANIDASNFRKIVGRVDWASRPVWSPDGRAIAYGCYAPDVQICVVKLDGTGMNVLTNENTNGSPSWSPDGHWIAFSSYRDNNWEIYIMKSDGSDQTRTTFNDLEDFGPRWRP